MRGGLGVHLSSKNTLAGLTPSRQGQLCGNFCPVLMRSAGTRMQMERPLLSYWGCGWGLPLRYAQVTSRPPPLCPRGSVGRDKIPSLLGPPREESTPGGIWGATGWEGQRPPGGPGREGGTGDHAEAGGGLGWRAGYAGLVTRLARLAFAWLS